MRPVVTSAEMRAIDAAMINEVGLPGVVLMENAGRAVAETIVQFRQDIAFDSVVVVAGGGNNGGDGFVIARYLREAGLHAIVMLVGSPDGLTGDAACHAAVYQQLGGVLEVVDEAADWEQVEERIGDADLIVDALFGTGLSREVVGLQRAVIEAVNDSGAMVLSVDLPSGMCADTGAVHGAAVRADVTVTLGAAKLGLVSSPGFSQAGALVIAGIGLDTGLLQSGALGAGLYGADDAARAMPGHSLLDHKGTRGRIAIVGGSPGRRGAPRLAALAALRTGAGLVTLIGESATELAVPDAVMSLAVGSFASDGDTVLAACAEMDAIAIGPGLPRSDGALGVLHGLLDKGKVALVIDADGLNLLAGNLEVVAASSCPVVLTPHPGEAARLLDTTVSEIERDRVAAVRALAAKAKCVCVLKGPRTLICDGNFDAQFVAIIESGHPALATAGSGDVLAGTIVALIGQGCTSLEAARLGAWVHGMAGEALAIQRGNRGVIASDLPEAIAAVLHDLHGGVETAE